MYCEIVDILEEKSPSNKFYFETFCSKKIILKMFTNCLKDLRTVLEEHTQFLGEDFLEFLQFRILKQMCFKIHKIVKNF